MAKYKLTHRAIDDLTQIWNYTFDKWSENQADKYYYMLLNYCQEAANCPQLGKHYSVIMENLHGIKAGRHIIFYQSVTDDTIEIIRILHEQMDLKNRMK